MNEIRNHKLKPDEAALWFLGQAGFVIRSGDLAVAIDPYLSDSVGASDPQFGRNRPVPLAPEDLDVDLYLVTHDHADHLDPETINRYGPKAVTDFVAPRFAARKLVELGIRPGRVTRIDTGEEACVRGVTIRGVFALPTGADVLDTSGYLVTFPNGRCVYHAGDTGFTPLLLQAAPRDVDVLLVPINGKWGNLTVEQAVDLARATTARYVVPTHYDVMALNSENPETFRWFCKERRVESNCVIPAVMEPFVWA